MVLDYKKNSYEHSKLKYSKFDSMKDITQIKKIPEYSWLNEIDSVALQTSICDLDDAYQNFFRTKNYPKFKNKNSKQSYRTNRSDKWDNIRIEGKKIKLPKLGFVSFRNKAIITENIKSVTISKTTTGKYFASILVEFDAVESLPMQINTSKVFAADMSCKNFIVSEEMEFENQKFYRSDARKLAIRSRRLSRKKKGSNNRKKSRHIVARVHEDIKNKRDDYQKKLAHEIVSNFDAVILEDLDIKGMQKNSGISKTVTSDFSWSSFTNFLEWKCFKEDVHFVKIDRWFPSSKLCNECGTVKGELSLSERVYSCDCGYSEDRDINAVKNIKREGLGILEKLGVNLLNPTEDPSESYACGDMTEITMSAQENRTLMFC